MSPQRRGKLNGDHTVTQLAMSWIREDWEEEGKEEGAGLENARGRWSETLPVKTCTRKEGDRGERMDEKQTAVTAGDEEIYERFAKNLSDISLRAFGPCAATPHCLTVVHLHVCVRGGNTDCETERVQE